MFQWETIFKGKKCACCRQVVTKAGLTVAFCKIHVGSGIQLLPFLWKQSGVCGIMMIFVQLSYLLCNNSQGTQCCWVPWISRAADACSQHTNTTSSLWTCLLLHMSLSWQILINILQKDIVVPTPVLNPTIFVFAVKCSNYRKGLLKPSLVISYF